MNDDDVKLTLAEAAKILGKTKRTLYNYEKKGLLRIDHGEKGVPFILRSQVSLVLDKKNDKVKKTEYVPEGCVVIPQDIYDAKLLQIDNLLKREQILIEHKETVEKNKEEIAQLKSEREAIEADKVELQRELEAVKNRGLFSRIFNKGVA